MPASMSQRRQDITGAGEDLAVAEEAAAGEVSCVCAQLPGHPHGALFRLQVVNRANVVQTTTGHKVSRGGILKKSKKKKKKVSETKESAKCAEKKKEKKKKKKKNKQRK